jgi:hypothetical protein
MGTPLFDVPGNSYGGKNNYKRVHAYLQLSP